jgi:hypothetical protein
VPYVSSHVILWCLKIKIKFDKDLDMMIIMIMLQARTNLAYAEYRQAKYNEFFRDAVIEDYADGQIQRLLKDLKDLGTAKLTTEEFSALSAATTRMSNTYNLATICPYQEPGCNLADVGLTLDPGEFKPSYI